MKIILSLLATLLLSACAREPSSHNSSASLAHIDRLDDFPSRYVIPRRVDIWLPRQYFTQPDQPLPVLYMHDGQNLFNPDDANFDVAWEVDNIGQRLMDEGRIRPAIVVGIWSTPRRRLEYFPEGAAAYFSPQDVAAIEALKAHLGETPELGYQGDEYLKFLVEELKPYVDSHYRTLPDRANTLIAGSSMGGLISAYAISEYPQVFGRAACVSTHWPLLFNNDNPGPAESLRQYLVDHLPPAGQHRIYFDFGTATLDQYYEVHQLKVDKLMAAKGYVQGRDWVTKKFPGAEHNEKAWQARMDVILEFLLAPSAQ